MKTGITFDCPCCGATGVPLGWEWKAYVHESGAAWAGYPGRFRNRCFGPRESDSSADGKADMFSWLLRNAGLAAGPGDLRMATDREMAAGVYIGGPNDMSREGDQ